MIRRLIVSQLATLVRIALIFTALVLVWDAGLRLFVQLAPASLWFEFSRVEILPSGTVTIVYRRSLAGDLPMAGIVELIGPGGEQPCAAANRRVIERDTSYAVAPIQRLLPDCDWSGLASGDYRLSITMSYAAAHGYEKSVTVRSTNAIMVRDGVIVGATDPAHEPG